MRERIRGKRQRPDSLGAPRAILGLRIGADVSEPEARCAPSGVGGGGGVGCSNVRACAEAVDEVAAELCYAIRDVVAYVLQPSTALSNIILSLRSKLPFHL